MATTSLQVAREELAGFLGYGDEVGLKGLAWTTTTNLATSMVVISTELRNAGFDDIGASGSGDDRFQNRWAYFLGTSNSQVERRIKSYTASSGTLTVAGTVLASESGASDFEIHRYRPSLLNECLYIASRQGFPMLHQPITRTLYTGYGQVRYEVPSAIIGRPDSIIVDTAVASDFGDSILTDGGFEIWTNSTTLTNWSATTLDVAQETATTVPRNYAVMRDTYSARCTSQTGSVGTLLQTISSPSTHSGQKVSLSVWVYCLTASVVSTRITVNATINLGTAITGGLHTGSGWELLTQTVDTTVTLTTLTVGVSVVATATDNTEFYVDEAICVVGPTQEPEIRGQEIFNWDWVPIMQGTTYRNEIVLPYLLPAKRRLRFEGKAYLSTMTAEADTIEIGPPQTYLLYALAVEELSRRLVSVSADVDSTYQKSLADRAHTLRQRYGGYAMSGRSRRDLGPDWGR